MTFKKTCSVCGAPAGFRLTAKAGRTPGGDTATTEHRDACREHIDTVNDLLAMKYGTNDLRIYMDRIERDNA